MPRNIANGLLVWLPILLAVALFVFGGLLTKHDFSQTTAHLDWASPGIRGDFWGGHIAAAAGLAGTFLLFSAVMMQRNELRLQRDELKLQRLELAEGRRIAKDQAMALEDQVVAIEKQTEQLKRQIVIAESQKANSVHRNNIDVIISLALRAQSIRGESQVRMHAIIRVAFRQIVGVASVEYETATDLLQLFMGILEYPKDRPGLHTTLDELGSELLSEESVNDVEKFLAWSERACTMLKEAHKLQG